jgi:hypothetical protein
MDRPALSAHRTIFDTLVFPDSRRLVPRLSDYDSLEVTG